MSTPIRVFLCDGAQIIRFVETWHVDKQRAIHCDGDLNSVDYIGGH